MPHEVTVHGIRAQASGALYVEAVQPDLYSGSILSGRFPFGDFVGGPGEAIKTLKRQGIFIIGKAAVDRLQKDVEALDHFETREVAEHIGWNGAGLFCLPDALISAGEVDRVVTTFFRDASKCSLKGSLHGWQDGVASRLEGQHLALFVLLVMFIAPLLRLTDRVGNFGFELVGPKGFGKSTLQYIASSVLGGATQGDDGHYWIGLDTTINALEDTMEAHSDLPIVYDEAGLLAAGAPDKEKAEIYKALVFKLGSGEQKSRMGAYKRPPTRHTFLVSANDSLSDLTKRSSESARAAGDRLITIRVPDREYKTFDHLPEGFAGSTELAKALQDAANEHHGYPIRAFLQGLVSERAKNEERLRKRIAKGVKRFIARTGISSNDGSAYRVAQSFALAAVAGRLAQRFKVLPRTLDVVEAALECYRMHIASIPADVHFSQRLAALAESEATVVINDAGARQSKTALKAVQSALAVRHRRSDGDRLLIDPKRVLEAFPDWGVCKKLPEVRALLEMEVSKGETKLTKHICRAKGLPRDRQLIFKLPSASTSDGETLFDE